MLVGLEFLFDDSVAFGVGVVTVVLLVVVLVAAEEEYSGVCGTERGGDGAVVGDDGCWGY